MVVQLLSPCQSYAVMTDCGIDRKSSIRYNPNASFRMAPLGCGQRMPRRRTTLGNSLRMVMASASWPIFPVDVLEIFCDICDMSFCNFLQDVDGSWWVKYLWDILGPSLANMTHYQPFSQGITGSASPSYKLSTITIIYDYDDNNNYYYYSHYYYYCCCCCCCCCCYFTYHFRTPPK